MSGCWSIGFNNQNMLVTIRPDGTVQANVGLSDIRTALAVRSDNDADFPADKGWYKVGTLLFLIVGGSRGVKLGHNKVQMVVF